MWLAFFFIATLVEFSKVSAIHGDEVYSKMCVDRAKELEARIATIDVPGLALRSQFVNAQIRERAFSFSELLDELERTLPHDVRLLDLNPTFDEDGTIRLSLSCAARKRDGMIDLLNRLIEDDSFADAFPRSERIETDGTLRFFVDVNYLPAAREAAE